MRLSFAWLFLAIGTEMSMAMPTSYQDYQIESAQFSTQISVQPPLKTNDCINKLYQLLKGGEARLQKDRDQLDSLIKEIAAIANQKSCDDLDRAISYTYTAKLLLSKYQSNAYQYDQRTSLLDTIPADMNQWSSNIYFQKIFENIQLALSCSEQLQQTKAYQLHEFFTVDSPIQNESVYSVIRLELLQLLESLAYIPRLATSFVQYSQTNPALLGDINTFVHLKMEGSIHDAQSLTLQIYQQLLAHSNPSNLLSIDLQRLQYCAQLPIENSAELYIKQLKELFAANEATSACVQIADLLFNEEFQLQETANYDGRIENKSQVYEKRKDLLNRINDILKKYSNLTESCGLKNLKALIERGSVNTEIASLQYQNQPMKLILHHTNCKAVRLAVLSNKNDTLWQKQYALSDTLTLIEQQKQIQIPGLSYGSYRMIAYSYPVQSVWPFKLPASAHLQKEFIDSTRFVVSDLASQTKTIQDNACEIRVVDRKTGKPIPDATVVCKTHSYRMKTPQTIGTYQTNKEGLAILTNLPKSSFYYQISKGADHYSPEKSFYLSRISTSMPERDRTDLFTDRAVYRPGQTVYYKGIVYHSGVQKSEAKEGIAVEVNLYNSQNKIISTQTHTTDRFGSIAGDFKLPKNTLNGRFRIATPLASRNIEVADYKRPSFLITINKPTTAYAFGDEISITGNVKTFSGVSLGNSDIQYQINYQPAFWRSLNPQRIKSGILKCNAQGDFMIAFQTDLPKSNRDGLYGLYDIQITATDEAGEVQQNSLTVPISTSSLNLDFLWDEDEYRTIQSSTNINLYIDRTHPKRISFNAFNPSGEPISLQGKLRIYRYTHANALPEAKTDSTMQFIQDYSFETQKSLEIDAQKWQSGKYLFEMKGNDSKGRPSIVRKEVILYALSDKQPPYPMANWLVCDHTSCQIGEKTAIYFGSSYQNLYVLYEQITENGILESVPMILSNQIQKREIAYQASYPASYKISFLSWKEDKGYNAEQIIYKTIPSRKLMLRTDVFRDKLEPGEPEKWKFTVLNSDSTIAQAQVLADLYDASLDKIAALNWYFNPFYMYSNHYPSWQFRQNLENNTMANSWIRSFECPLSPQLQLKDFGLTLFNRNRFTTRIKGRSNINQLNEVSNEIYSVVEEAPVFAEMATLATPTDETEKESDTTGALDKKQSAVDELKSTDVRTNLQETAFFYPNLLTNREGQIQLEFTMPQALTEWNLRMLATTPDMHYGFLQRSVVTTKDFMVVPNLPLFCRQGDKIDFTAMIYNKTDQIQKGAATLELFNPYTEEIIYNSDTLVVIPANTNIAVCFPATTPEGIDILGIRMKGGNQQFSDGEQQVLAVLPSRTLVTESMPMYLRGQEEKQFHFDSYLKDHSSSLQNYRYTVEYSGNPAWYVVEALPALSPILNQSSSAAIASYYVTTLAAYIAHADEGIQKAIQNWELRGEDQKTLVSNLQKNEELQQILLNESPWVLQAASETENIHALAQLFDMNRQQRLQQEALDLLSSLQNADGGIAWFAEMPSSFFQTLNTLECFARLTYLGVQETPASVKTLQIKALNYIDQEIVKRYERHKLHNKKSFIPGLDELLWAYIRSSYQDVPFYEGALPIHHQIIKYFEKHNKELSLYESAILSLTFRRYGKIQEANRLNIALRQKMTQSDEMGYYWANNRSNYRNSTLATHVALMTALYEGGATETEMNELKLWLLRQKQTQMWESAPATIDAIYGILMTGTNWLHTSKAPIVKVGNYTVTTSTEFAYADTTFQAKGMTPALGHIKIIQQENHPGFGAAYWQYFEDFDALRQQGKELKVEKFLFKQVQTPAGNALEPVTGPLQKGDIVITRLVATADRDYEFVTLKDQRAACFNPVEQISAYQWTERVGYYLETKDASTNYFFSRLPKGTYVFEYRMRTTQSGLFHDGISAIQCMYAPEFVGHTQGSKVWVK